MISKRETIKNKKGEYDVQVVFDGLGRLSDVSNCTCVWGSYYRYTEKNRGKKWMCRHIVKVYAKIVKISPVKARINLIKMGIMDEAHLKRI